MYETAPHETPFGVRSGARKFARGGQAPYDHEMRAVILALFAVVPSAVAAPQKPPESASEADAPDATDAPDARDSGAGAAPPAAHREGEYGGVRPGNAPAGDARPRAKMPRKGTLSWIGFEAKNGGADVFLQAPANFDVAQRVENGTLVVHLTGISQLGQNTWRYIDTRFFDSPVSRIVAKRVGAARPSKASPGHAAGVEVRISFKDKAAVREASLRNATEADGMYYAYLSFSGSPGT